MNFHEQMLAKEREKQAKWQEETLAMRHKAIDNIRKGNGEVGPDPEWADELERQWFPPIETK